MKSQRAALAALLLQLALVGTAGRLISLPLNRIIELRYCQEYYSRHDPSDIGRDGYIPDAKCKIDVVQQQLGWMQGAMETLLLLCDIVTTAPMGYLVDTMGTRLALVLNFSSTAVLLLWVAAVGRMQDVFPVGAVFAGPFLALYGGGSCARQIVTLALAATIAESETQRTSYLAYLTSVDYVTVLLSPAIAAALMEIDLYLPFWVGLGCVVVSLPLTRMQPHTRISSQSTPKTQVMDDRDTSPLLRQPLLESPSDLSSPYSVTDSLVAFFSSYFALVKGRRGFQLLLLAAVLSGIASSTTGILIRYASKRYDVPFTQVGYLLTAKAPVNIFMFLVFIPTLANFVTARHNYSPAAADLLGGKIALTLSAIGAASIAFSPHWWTFVISLLIYAMGSILPVYMYSLARSPQLSAMEPESEGRAYAIVVLCNSIGHLIGTPLLTALWVRAIDIGGRGLGLPFYATAIGYVASAAVWCGIRLVGAERSEYRD